MFVEEVFAGCVTESGVDGAGAIVSFDNGDFDRVRSLSGGVRFDRGDEAFAEPLAPLGGGHGKRDEFDDPRGVERVVGPGACYGERVSDNRTVVGAGHEVDGVAVFERFLVEEAS